MQRPRPIVIMGFLKKKWLKLLSKRKSKVNVVSIMSLVLIVQLGHNSIPNTSPFSISSHFATVHTPLLVIRTFQRCAEQWPCWTPFLNFTHFAAILISAQSSPQLQVTREEEQPVQPVNLWISTIKRVSCTSAGDCRLVNGYLCET